MSMTPKRFAGAAVAASSVLFASSSGAQGFAQSVIDAKLANIRTSLRKSETFGNRAAQAELDSIADQCGEDNWDGYGASAASPVAIDAAFRFLDAMPLGTPTPTVGIEPDGQITFEWYASPRWVLSVSVTPDGSLH